MSKNTPNPYDEFFKSMLSNRQIAMDFCKELLPKPILDHIDLRTLSWPKISYINRSLKEYFSDMVLRFR